VDSATFSIRNAIPDQLLDTGTLEVSETNPDDRDAQIGPVTDLDATIEIVEISVVNPARLERDSSVIASTLVLSLFFLAVPAGLAFSSKS
jgi:hypothetical protein